MVQKDNEIKMCSSSAKFLSKVLACFNKLLGNIKGTMKLVFFFSKILFNKKRRDNFAFMKICIKQAFNLWIWQSGYFRQNTTSFKPTLPKLVIRVFSLIFGLLWFPINSLYISFGWVIVELGKTLPRQDV